MTEIHQNCPHCQHLIALFDIYLGRKVRCPFCKAILQSPKSTDGLFTLLRLPTSPVSTTSHSSSDSRTVTEPGLAATANSTANSTASSATNNASYSADNFDPIISSTTVEQFVSSSSCSSAESNSSENGKISSLPSSQGQTFLQPPSKNGAESSTHSANDATHDQKGSLNEHDEPESPESIFGELVDEDIFGSEPIKPIIEPENTFLTNPLRNHLDTKPNEEAPSDVSLNSVSMNRPFSTPSMTQIQIGKSWDNLGKLAASSSPGIASPGIASPGISSPASDHVEPSENRSVEEQDPIETADQEMPYPELLHSEFPLSFDQMRQKAFEEQELLRSISSPEISIPVLSPLLSPSGSSEKLRPQNKEFEPQPIKEPSSKRESVVRNAQKGTKSRFLLGFFIFYSILISIVAIFFATDTPKPLHPFQAIPDVYGEYDRANRKELKSALLPDPKLEVPEHLQVKLGQNLVVGDLSIEPTKVEKKETEYFEQLRSGQLLQKKVSRPILCLYLRLKNRSKDVAFYPTDPAFNRQERKNQPIPYNQIAIGSEIYKGGLFPWPLDHNVLEANYLPEQKFDDQILHPQSERDTVIPSGIDAQMLRHLKKENHSLCRWRIQLRTGIIHCQDDHHVWRDFAVTSIIEVHFQEDEIQVPKPENSNSPS